jgi:hypothetical protein
LGKGTQDEKACEKEKEMERKTLKRLCDVKNHPAERKFRVYENFAAVI